MNDKFINFLKTYRYYIVTACFIAVVAVFGANWWLHNKNDAINPEAKEKAAQTAAEGETPYVSVFKVQKVRYIDTLDGLMGSVRGSSLELKSTQEEKLTTYHFKPGSYIKKGEVIVELERNRQQSRFKQEELNFERKKKLLAEGGATKSEVEQAEESYKMAKKDLDDTYITAGKNGYLGEVLLQEGELVNRQSPIAYFVSAEDPFFVETSIIEKQMPQVHKGQKANISIDIFPDKKIVGEVLSVSPEATTSSRMIPIRIAIPAEYRGRIMPGMSASCEVVVFDKNVVLIPGSCLLKNEPKVFVVNEKGEALKRDIELGYQSRDYVEVIKGLNEGELVINKPDYGNVKENGKVKYSTPEEYKSKDQQNKTPAPSADN
jgi:membrane fusion protein (multidrug efflux system)